MKWKKHGRNSRRKTYYEFWDYLDSEGSMLAFVRHDTRKGEFRVFANNAVDSEMDTNRYGVMPFKSLTDAKDHVIAYFVNKRLEDAHG